MNWSLVVGEWTSTAKSSFTEGLDGGLEAMEVRSIGAPAVVVFVVTILLLSPYILVTIYCIIRDCSHNVPLSPYTTTTILQPQFAHRYHKRAHL